MINLTIKTLDGGNHRFSVEDQSTVLTLKEKIRESLNIDLNKQRLIFGGRVLQDHVNLTALDVDGKVIHLVQRSPPCGNRCCRGPCSGTSSGPENPEWFEPTSSRYQMNDTDRRLVTVYELLLDVRECLHKLHDILQRHNDPLWSPPRPHIERPSPLEIVRPQNPHDYVQIYAEVEITFQQYEPYRLRFSHILRNVVSFERYLYDRAVKVVKNRDRSVIVGAQQLYIRQNNDPINRILVQQDFHNSSLNQINLLMAYMDVMNSIHHSFGHLYHAFSQLSFRIDDFNTPILVSEPAPNPMRPPSLLQTNGNIAPRPQQFNLGNPSANAEQGLLPDMEEYGPTTILLSSHTAMGNNVSQISLPPRATEQIMLRALDLDNVMRRMGNQNQMTETTTVGGIFLGVAEQSDSSSDEGGSVASGSNDHENDTSSNAQGDNLAMFDQERHIQELMQNIASVMRHGIAGSSQPPQRPEDRFTPRPVILPNLIYDRFLFCNSRHAHAALQRRRYHQSYQFEERQQAATREIELSLLVMVDRVPGLTVENAIHIAQLLNLLSFPETYMNAALTLLVRQFYVNEPLLYLGHEVPMVKEFEKLRAHHHAYASEIVERSNGDIVDYVMDRLAPFLNTLPYVTTLRPDLDLAASLRAYFTVHLPSNIEAMTTAPSTDGMRSILQYFERQTALFRDLCTIVYHHCQSGIPGFCKAFQHFMRLLIDPMAERVKPLFQILSSAVMNSVVNSLDINSPRVEEFIHARMPPNEDNLQTENPVSISIVVEDSNDSNDDYVSGGVRQDYIDANRGSQHLYAGNAAAELPDAIVISDDEESEILKESEPIDVSATMNAQTAENIDLSLQTTATQPMDTTVSVSATLNGETAENIESSLQTTAAQPMDTTVSVSATLNAESAENIESSQQITATEPMDTTVNVSATLNAETADNIESSLQTATTSMDPYPGTSSGSGNYTANDDVAGTSNADEAELNWGQYYTPVFHSDEAAQRVEGSGEPLSDAYLAGMPASKRLCVRRQRPPSNLREFLAACINAAAANLQMSESDMCLALRIHMRNLGRRRFATNQDINESLVHEAAAAEATRRFVNARRLIDLERTAPNEDDPNAIPNPNTNQNQNENQNPNENPTPSTSRDEDIEN